MLLPPESTHGHENELHHIRDLIGFVCGVFSGATATSHDDWLIVQPLRDMVGNILLGSRAESAHEIDDKAYHQNQANPAAADDRTSKVKPAAAEQKKKNK